MRNPFPIFLTSLLFVALPGLVAAQSEPSVTEDRADTLSVILEPVEVEATHSSITLDRAPMAVTTLRRSMMDVTARTASTMDELTFSLPGVWISNRENHALGERMVVRGMGWRSQFGIRGIQVVLDDIPLTVADGQSIMNMVDPAMIQSLELLRGPSATFWGNSSGGVLYLRTRMPAEGPNLMLRSFGGSYNTMKHEARWQDQIGGIRWNGYGSYYQTDGFRDYSAAQLIRGGLSAGMDLGENSHFEARLAYAGMPFAEHPGSLSGDDARNAPSMAWPRNEELQAGKEFHQLMGSASFIHNFGPGILNVSAHGIYRDLENPLPGPYIMVDRQAGGARTTYDFNSLPFELQIGAEVKGQRDDRNQSLNDAGSPGEELTISQLDRVGNQSLFARTAVDVGRFTVSAGLRADRMVFKSDSIDTVTGDLIAYEDEERIFTTVNPSFGIHYHLSNARLFANVSTSFESPTTTEFKNRLGADGNILPGFNPNLDPERTLGLETGIRGYFQDLNLEYDVALFGLFVKDQIIQETEIDGQALFSNGGEAEHFGVETHIRLRPVHALSLEFMYSWVHATFSSNDNDQLEGNRLPGVAPHRVGSSASLYLGNHVVTADVEWTGEYHVDSANSSVNDDFALLHARWMFNGLDFDSWQLRPFLSARNILDTRYNTSIAVNNDFGRYYEPGSGRNLQAGISLTF